MNDLNTKIFERSNSFQTYSRDTWESVLEIGEFLKIVKEGTHDYHTLLRSKSRTEISRMSQIRKSEIER